MTDRSITSGRQPPVLGAGSDWPVIGREEELALLRQLRTASPPMSAVVTGPPGVGKSRLASVAATEAAEDGWATLVIRGSAGFTGVPLGPLRTVLRTPHAVELTTLAVSIEHELSAMRSSKGLIVVVNDGHELDEHSAGLLHQLVGTGTIVCILTMRSGAHVHDAITDLWKDDLAQRLELQNLSQRETTEMISAALGGSVQDSSAHRIWQITGGNPLYVREVVMSSVETGTLIEFKGEWRWRGEWATGARLREIVAARIGRLDPDDSRAMELIALADTLPVTLVAELTNPRAIEALEERSLVTVERSGHRFDVTITNPLYSEVLRGQIPALRQRAMLRTLVDALTRSGVRRNADRVRLACWSLEAGLPVDPMTLALGTDAAIFGIGHAISGRLSEIFPSDSLSIPDADGLAVRQDFQVAIRLAETAFESTGALAEGVSLAKALAWTGSIGRAEGVLADLVDKAADRDDRARLALALAWIRFWGRYEVDAAVETLRNVTADEASDPGLRADAYEQLAGIALNTAQPATALAYAERAAAVKGVDLSRSVAAAAAAAALAYLGRCGQSIALVDRAVPMAEESGRTLTAAMLLFAKAGALAGAGALEESLELAGWLRHVALSNDLLDASAVFGVLLGQILLRQGKPVSAERILRDSSGRLAERDSFGYRPWALISLARAETLAGAEAAAEGTLAEAKEVLSVVRHFEGSRYLAEIELHHLAGRSAAGVEAAREGVAWARAAGLILEEAQMIDAWVRIAPSPTLAARLAELHESTDSQLVEVLADHARALVDGEPETLLVVSERFAGMTAWWLAAEAAASAARLFDQRHEARASQAAARAATGFASRCEGARTSAADAVGRPVRLTRRESEVARLAAVGHSSQEIAGRLHVSRRTVESHLHHAYVKLGVTDRTELAIALASPNSP